MFKVFDDGFQKKKKVIEVITKRIRHGKDVRVALPNRPGCTHE